MRDETREDARTVWQHQPTPQSGITLDKLRQKTQELRVKTRRELFGNIALGLIAIGFSIHGLLHTHARGWQIAMALLTCWALAGQYISHRGMWSERSRADSAASAGLDVYRHELKRRHDVFRRFVGWSFGPAVLALLSWILVMIGIARHLQIVVNFLPFGTLAVLWAIGILVLRFRARKELKRELDELALIEPRDNGPN